MMLYRLWSFEHTAFWLPNERGYTHDVRQAGKYPADRAREIVDLARGDEIAILATLNNPGQPASPDVIVFDPTSVEAQALPPG